MSDQKTKKINVTRVKYLIFIIITVLLALTSYQSMRYHNLIQNLSYEVENLNEDADSLNKKIELRENQYNKLKEDFDDLQKRMENIKDANDLLKRDIQLYIEARFTLIPNIVAKEISDQIVELSSQENISPFLLVGIIEVESSFNPSAVSKKNARGLMQLMPEWAPKLGVKKVSDFHDIDINISSGIKVLKIHIKEGNGSITKGLYYYVGKSNDYADNVYKAMGKFVAFRSTIDDSDTNSEENGDDEKEEKTTTNDNSNKGAEESN
jgi:hypothetical protein